jgi:hypothetical protein
MNHFKGTGRRQNILLITADSLGSGNAEYGTKSFASGHQ